MRVKRKDLKRFFCIADNYFVSYGGMTEKNIKFIDKFIRRYKLE